MSRVAPGDDHLHYSDGSHRWVAQGSVSQQEWERELRVHLEQHLAIMDGHPSDTHPLRRQGAAEPARRSTRDRHLKTQKPPQNPGR